MTTTKRIQNFSTAQDEPLRDGEPLQVNLNEAALLLHALRAYADRKGYYELSWNTINLIAKLDKYIP